MFGSLCCYCCYCLLNHRTVLYSEYLLLISDSFCVQGPVANDVVHLKGLSLMKNFKQNNNDNCKSCIDIFDTLCTVWGLLWSNHYFWTMSIFSAHGDVCFSFTLSNFSTSFALQLYMASHAREWENVSLSLSLSVAFSISLPATGDNSDLSDQAEMGTE